MNFCRKKGSKLQQALWLLLLTVCATLLLKVYLSRDCGLSDLHADSGNPSRAICRDRLYPYLRLSLPESINCSGGPSIGAEGSGGWWVKKMPPLINCSLITEGDEWALEQAVHQKQLNLGHQSTKKDEYMNLTQDCSQYRASRRFMPVPLSREEEDFPIAYSMVIHNNLEMFERLLRSLYTPQNIYCVHVDAKAPEEFLRAVQAIVSCFDNVFVASKLEKVVYASWSRVQADLNCMEDLLHSHVPWKYLLNTCGTDFPIKTNAEMVRALRVLNGRNSLESEKPSGAKKSRWQVRYEVHDGGMVQTQVSKDPPPINSPMFSGNAYFVVSRDFVKAIFEQPVAKKLVEWAKDTYSPDEHLWATLHRMPEMPGSVPHNDKYELSDMIALARLVKWHYLEGDISKGAPYPPCTGIHRRAVCVYGAGDLHWMLQQHHLLANKFDPSVDNTAIQCLEDYLRHKALYGVVL